MKYLYIAAAIACLALGWWLGSRVSATALANERAASAQQQKMNDDVAVTTLQTQISDLHATIQHNTEVTNDLATKNAAVESDRDFAQRLLASTRAANTALSGAVSEANHRSAVTEARAASGVERLTQLCAAVDAEDQFNANTLDALNAQLTPQL